MLEVQVAVVLLTVLSLASWATINSTLSLMGSKPSWTSQKAARLWTEASTWVQSELEYTKGLGYGGGCSSTPCTIWVRTLTQPTVEVSTDGCVTWSSTAAPFSQGPALPGDFPWGRVVIATDPNSPTDSYTGASTLQLIEVDVFRTQPTCASPSPYATSYTSAGLR